MKPATSTDPCHPETPPCRVNVNSLSNMQLSNSYTPISPGVYDLKITIDDQPVGGRDSLIAVAVVDTENVDVDALFTERYCLEQARDAYALFDGQQTGKGVFEF